VAGPFAGIKVIELANWTFVPAAGAIMADLGAEVIKVEPPTGDPQRGLKNLLNFEVDGPNPFLEIPNRGKRSVVIDLTTDAGREAFLRIAATCDVLLTSTLPAVRQKLGVDVDDVRAVNPSIIYMRGSGWGTKGPMRDVGGYDLASGWATSGLAYKLTPEGGEPPPQPAAFFDLQGANTIAGAVAMALLKRERTGEPSVVDVSLMSVGMWTLAPDIVGAPYSTSAQPAVMSREKPGNPIVNWYRTSDGRWLYLVCLQADRFWAELCNVIDRPELADDPRFVDAGARFQNRGECVRELDATFGSKTLAEWREILTKFTGVWAPVQSFRELHEHAQVDPNGYLPTVTRDSGSSFRLVAPPMQFDDVPGAPQGPAPELGQDTELVLLDTGMDWDEISAARDAGAFG
jgi:formyl-CoA transferase